MEFNPSANTVGIEWELQLLDPESLDLAPGIIPLMEFFPDNPFIKPEHTQCCVEITSDIAKNSNEAVNQLRVTLGKLIQRCRELEISLCGAGTHPFCRRLALITPHERYLEFEKAAGYLAHTQITFSTHVHVGLGSGDEAIRAMSFLAPAIPVFVALSANSPFWRGHKTGHVAYRHRILAASRTYGIPPHFETWQDFDQFLRVAKRSGMIRHFKDIHWDARPHPDFGTVELRVMDAASDLRTVQGLAAFTRALILCFSNASHAEVATVLPLNLPDWMAKQNRFVAGVQGMEAQYIVNEKGQTRSIREIANNLIEFCRPTAIECGESDGLDIVKHMLNSGCPAERQLNAYHQEHSARSVVKALESMLIDKLP